MTPQQLIDAYLAEARRVNGDEYADATRLSYNRGWFRLRSPFKYDGRYFLGSVNNIRRAKLEQMTAVLKTRKNYAQTALDNHSETVL